MAIQRVVLDTRGNNILSLFENNMAELGALNQLAASTDDDGQLIGQENMPDVNINYPRDGTSYSRMGREPGPYESYHVREITLKRDAFHDLGFRTESGVKTMLTKDDNDGRSARPYSAGDEYSWQGKSSTNLLQNHGMYSNESGVADPSKFMKLKLLIIAMISL